MPKYKGAENSKAVEARARKAAKKQEETDRKTKEAEDELWRDDDKHCARKQQRKDGKEKKKLEAVHKKQELQELFDKEMAAAKSSKPVPAAKLTRAEIEAARQREAALATAEAKKKATPHDEIPIEENVNRLEVEGEEARTVDEAISALSIQGAKVDKHPEKRMKAAYQEFEEINLPRLKVENPNMRLSQLKQMLKKDWMKSPENPVNQRFLAYNEKKH